MINTDPNNENNVLNAREVSEYLRIPLSTVYALAKKGQLKGVKIGKHWRYLKSDICNYLNGSVTTHSFSSRERRAQSRINCEIPGALLVALTRGSGVEKTGVIQNLCEGGVFMAVMDMNPALRVGDPVYVTFELPDGHGEARNGREEPRKIRSDGRIVRIHRDGEYALAVKFRAMKPEDREAIKTYVG